MKEPTRKWTNIALSMVLVTSLLTACTNNAGDKQSVNSEDVNQHATAEASKGNVVPEGAEGKYDPPIKLTTVRQQTSGVEYLPDQTLDNNVWTREFQSELGIELTNKWIVNNQQYPNKITVTMVSGDLPDFFEVNMQQFQTLAQAGQLADLSEVFEKYASDTVKGAYNESDGIKLKAGTIGGKLLGLALDGGNRDDAHVLYIREDWLKNVGRSAPTTIDELMDIAIAFAKEDPDKNGLNDTYGFALSKDIFGGFASVEGFLNAFGAYGFNPANGSGTNLMIQKGSDGKAQWADAQPDVKTALGKLHELFEAGAIHPEFSVMDGGKIGEQLTSSKVGMLYGAFWVPTWPINNMHHENNSVDWGVYEAPSANGTPTVVQSSSMPSRFMVVAKKFEHPEALIKILNYTTERLAGVKKDVSKYHTVKKGDKNYQIHTLVPISAPFGDRNQNYHYDVLAALKSGDKSKLDEEALMYLDQIEKFQSGDTTQWVGNKLWNENGVFATLGRYKKSSRIVMTAYTGPPTPTLVSRGPSLRDLQIKAFTEIIMGSKELDYFDDFVKQWQEQGGNDILAEINETGQLQ